MVVESTRKTRFVSSAMAYADISDSSWLPVCVCVCVYIYEVI